MPEATEPANRPNPPSHSGGGGAGPAGPPVPAPGASSAAGAAVSAHAHGEGPERERVLIRAYPKTVFLYPVAVAALLCGLATAFGVGNPKDIGFVFCTVFLFNLVIISFEFTRHISVALVLTIFVIVLLGMLLNERLRIVDFIRAAYSALDLRANAGFYFAIAAAYALTLLGIFVDTRFDYWEIRGNEILHHHGFLGDLERFPAPQIKLRKEITDVFEYLLLSAGRLVIFPSPNERPVVLDNVPRINTIEEHIEEMLDSLRVTIESAPPKGKQA